MVRETSWERLDSSRTEKKEWTLQVGVCVCVGGSRVSTDEHMRKVQNILGASENTTPNGSLWPDCKSFMTV